MTPPSRRQTLQAVGLAVASTAGCLGAPESATTPATERDTPSQSPSSTPTAPTLAPGETYAADDDRTVRVGDLDVRQSVVSVEYVSSTHYYERVAATGAGQYVAFDVAVEGFDLGPDGREQYGEPIDLPLAVEVDGERHGDPIPVGRDRAAARDRIAVRVPVVDASTAAVVWTRDDGPQPRWTFGSAVTEQLAAAPEFEVRDWSVPEQVEHGERFDVSVTVANVGDRDGRFLATLGVEQGSLGVPETAVTVPVGETRPHTVTLDPHYFEGMASLDVVLDWDVDRRTATVAVTGSPSGTETGTPLPK